MPVHVALLAVPAVAGGFMQAFQFAFLLWPFNLALPLARHLRRACIALRSQALFYAAELRRYVNGARRAPPSPWMSHQYASLRVARQWTPDEGAGTHAMIALIDISY